MTWHGYFGIENINLNEMQRTILVTALCTLGPASNRQPAKLIHWRTRPDKDAVIFEALFNKGVLTVQAWKNRLGVIFDVNSNTIDYDTTTRHFAGHNTSVITFSRNETDYLRVVLFGGLGATWSESGDECRAFLAQNIAEWEPEEESGIFAAVSSLFVPLTRGVGKVSSWIKKTLRA